jgi:iron complex transport system substrate-binding protein
MKKFKISFALLLALAFPIFAGTAYAAGYPVELDNYGRKIVVKSAPKKVLTLGPNCTELFIALGLSDRIVGTSLRNHSRGPLPEYAETYKKIPELNYGSATREAVIASGADFIYGIDWEFGGNSAALDIGELEKFGMTVYMNSAATPDQMYKEIRDLGRIFGIEDRSEAFIKDQQNRIAAVQKKVAGQKPIKALVYDSGNSGVFTASGANFESIMIDLAGGTNIFSDIKDKQWTTVSYEEVLARTPDIIIIHDYDKPSVEEKIAEIKSSNILSRLDCVKNERFAIISLENMLPGNRMALTVEILASSFYPELFKQQ